MPNFQPITLPNNNITEKPKTVVDIKLEDYIPEARKLLTDAGNDVGKQSEAIVDIVRNMMAYDNAVKMKKFLDVLAKEFKIPKGDFTVAIKEAQADQKAAETTETEGSPQISRVEKFIKTKYQVYFNLIANKFMYREKEDKEFRELIIDNIYRDLQKSHIRYSISDLKSLFKSDFIMKKNVFVDYFENLPAWDGVDHIEKLSSYVHVQEISRTSNERERYNNMFKKMFVRSVACSLEADFNKQCFTFVHEQQNSGKSTFMRWLCPPALEDYYTENIGTSKDDLIALTENFIVNIDELSTLSKYDINALKSVMSKHKVKVRLPYGDRPEILQRRCNFVASTNRLEFLNDETGSVRWVCFLLDRINWDYMKDMDINKIWSQAYHLFSNTNFDYQLTPKEIDENEHANKTFLIRSPEMELIQKYIEPSTKEDFDKIVETLGREQDEIKFMSATEVLTMLSTSSGSHIKLSSVNVGKSLKILGFVQFAEYRPELGMSIKGYFVRKKKENEDAPGVLEIKAASLQEVRKENKQADLPF